MTMLPREEHERRMALYRDGLNDREIADQVHVTPEAITFWRKNHGLTANTPRSKITPAMEAEMLRMHQGGMSDGQISQESGMKKATVVSWRRRRGLADKLICLTRSLWTTSPAAVERPRGSNWPPAAL